MWINRCWNCMGELGQSPVCPHCGFNPETYVTPTNALPPYTILRGKYLVGNVLGQGGFGITYIAFDLTLEMKVAIKEYFPMASATRNSAMGPALQWRDVAGGDQSWRIGCLQFLSEARKMAKIHSIPNVVGVRDTFEENNTAYIVMDYVPGMTLKDYVRRNGCFTYSDCVELLLPLIDGLDKAHRQGIIHRDISPDNLMLTPDGKIFLLDLGAAKDMKDASEQQMVASKQGFSPIEQNATGGRVGPWTDVYALAASIYYCVFGRVVPSSMDRFNEDTLSFESKGKHALTSEQVKVMKRGLAIQPEMRYQTAMEFYIALRETAKKKKAKKLLPAILGGVAAVALAVGGWLLAANKPWLPTVEVPLPASSGDYLSIENQYEYYTDFDGSLLRVEMDEEERSFLLDTAEVIYAEDSSIYGDGVSGLGVTEEFMYFTYFGGAGNPDYLIAMDFDGTDRRTLLTLENYDHDTPMYTKFSNGEEYFYYLMDDGVVENAESETPEYHLYLYRYNLETAAVEQVLTEEIRWYTLYDKYLYYVVYDADAFSYNLYRTGITGGKTELLDNTSNYYWGVVSENQLYLLNGDGFLTACDVDAKPLSDDGVTLQWTDANVVIGGNWVFYNEAGSDELYRVRLNGKDKQLVLSGYTYGNLSYSNSWLYFQDGTDIGGENHLLRAYLAYYDGSSVVDCGFDAQVITDEQGCQYVIEDGIARMVGYVGTELDVILPLEFNGYPFDTSVDWDTFYFENVDRSQVQFYVMIPESDLEYTRNENGITITGYSGIVTGADECVAIPTEIDGSPVVRIDDQAFQGCTFYKVYLPKQLQELGYESFDMCENLQWVVFPETLIIIESYAFWGSSFDGRDIVLPDSVVQLGAGIFGFATPHSVQLPAEFSDFNHGFMQGCGGEYRVSPNDDDLMIGEGGAVMSADGTTLFAFPYDYIGSYIVPSTVTTIAGGAFMSCQVSEVILPEGLLEIGKSAFWRCGQLTTIQIPATVQTIGEDAFEGSGLTEAWMDTALAGQAALAFDETVVLNYYPEEERNPG